MKAQRSAQNRIVLFRPTENAARMRNGAERLSMVPPPSDLFVGAVQQLVRDNQDYVPPQVLLHPVLHAASAGLQLNTYLVWQPKHNSIRHASPQLGTPY